MSVNWVMLQDHEGFVRLPHEQLVFTSPPRTGLSVQPLGGESTGQGSFSIQSSTGRVYLTNQRIVYIPAQGTKELQSFSAPLLNIHDAHVTAPFFGPNAWIAVIQPVSGGGIPPSIPAVQCKVTFKEGGAFDFYNHFERIKERLQQAVEVSQESRRGAPNVDMSTVHLEDLPAYSGPTNAPTETTPNDLNSTMNMQNGSSSSEQSQGPEPIEPPPGYEEVQQQSVAEELEERLRRAN